MKFVNLKFNHFIGQLKGHSLKENFWQLFVNNGLNLLAPAISLTYVFSVIGAEKFAFISFSTAMIGLLSFVIEFGFVTSMVRVVAINKHDRRKLGEIAISTIIVKLILCIMSIIGILVFLYFETNLKDYKQVLILSLGQLIGQALNLNYFFLGLQETKLLTKVNLSFKVIVLVCLFLLIKNADDYLYWPLIYSFASFFTSLILGLILFKKYLLYWAKPSIELILSSLKDGYYIFSANLSGSVLVYGPTLILGIISSKSILGYFSLAERISNVISVVFLSISQTILPNLSVLVFKKEKSIFKDYLVNLITFTSVLLIGGYLIFYFFMENLILYFIQNDFLDIVFIFKAVGFYTIITCLNTVVFPFLVSLKLDKSLSFSYSVMAVFFLLAMLLIYTLELDYSYLIYAITISQLLIFLLNLGWLIKGLGLLN